MARRAVPATSGTSRSSDDPAVICRCGNIGCLEALAGGAAIGRAGEAAAREGRSARLRVALDQRGAVTAEDVARAASFGDPVAVALLQAAGRRVGSMLASVVNFFNPSLIVIGGGVANSPRPAPGGDPRDGLPAVAAARHPRPAHPALVAGRPGRRHRRLLDGRRPAVRTRFDWPLDRGRRAVRCARGAQGALRVRVAGPGRHIARMFTSDIDAPETASYSLSIPPRLPQRMRFRANPSGAPSGEAHPMPSNGSDPRSRNRRPRRRMPIAGGRAPVSEYDEMQELEAARERNDLDIVDLRQMSVTELRSVGRDLEIEAAASDRRDDLVDRILQRQSERPAEVTPRPFTLPPRTCGSIEGMLANIICTVPEIRSP